MKKFLCLAVFAAVCSGCSDYCAEGNTYCKSDSVYEWCDEQGSGNWVERTCDSKFEDPGPSGTVCVTKSDGYGSCYRKCNLGEPARCDGDNYLVLCLENKYKNGDVGGYQSYEFCTHGCSVISGVAQCEP
ncbi:MAG: hypothetical protein IJU23_01995 [Proteobacteria bacterium]|nr:hypothetical protein [Pseudomonadota bacterium]